MLVDTAGAFCPHGRFELTGAPSGLLVGRTFAVKDLFDIAGHVTGAGNPKWLATHASAEWTAPPVAALLAAGATMIGKTITDELAYSLNGDNIHYGTPRNSKAPDRVPGGSSSGSAAAVAAELCDFARLTAIAGLSEVTVPGLVASDGPPLGLFFIGPAGADRMLLALAHQISSRTTADTFSCA